MTLPTDPAERKATPLNSGLFAYFPDALAGVAQQSVRGQIQHNLGERLYDNRSNSVDDADCILRHQMDVNEMLPEIEAETGEFSIAELLEAAEAVAWRALRQAQKLHEKYNGARIAPAAVIDG